MQTTTGTVSSSHNVGTSTAAGPEEEFTGRRPSTALETNVTSRPPSAFAYRNMSANVSRRGASPVSVPGSEIAYPSWLPHRPSHPRPSSTIPGSIENGGGTRNALAHFFNFGHSRNVTADSSNIPASSRYHTQRESLDVVVAGSRINPRSIRIVSEPHDDRVRESTEHTKRSPSYSHVRGFSRSAQSPFMADAFSMSPTGVGPHEGFPPLQIPAPRFKANSLNIALLRYPGIVPRLQFHFSPITYFAHVLLQLFLDFNVVYILVQVTSFPTPLALNVPPATPSPTWTVALVSYIILTLFWLIGVVIIYEIVWCFWRRWRVKRPGMLGIFSSRPARKLVGMGSFDRWCFLTYVQRGAWTDRTELEADNESIIRRSWSGKPLSQASEPDVETQSLRLFPRILRRVEQINWKQGLVEWAWNRSQNLPTVTFIVPRACIALTVLLAFSAINPSTLSLLNSRPLRSISTDLDALEKVASPVSRDATFFSTETGALTGYARAVLWINCIWALWRSIILIGSYITLWIASGQSCAGICGPRHRWEEEDREEWEDATNAGLQEKYARPLTMRRGSLSGDTTVGGYMDRDMGENQLGWAWKENMRRRVREAYEFCLMSQIPHGKEHAKVETEDRRDTDDTNPSNPPLTALNRALAPKSPARTRITQDVFVQPDKSPVEESSSVPVPAQPEVIVPVEGSQSNASPVTPVPYPFPSYQNGGNIPFPAPGGNNYERVAEEDGYEPTGPDEFGYTDLVEEDAPSERRTTSMSSLGQPISPMFPFFANRRGRGHNSGSTGGGSRHQSPHGHSVSARSHHTSGSGSKGSRSTPSGKSDYVESPSQTSSPITNLPPPPSANSSNGRDRRRASTGPSSATPPTHMALERIRTLPSHGVPDSDPRPHPAYEPSGDEHELVAQEDDALLDGTQEDAENADSVGLLSNAPSPKGSFAAIRQRASSLSHNRQRTRSQGGSGSASVQSFSGNGGGNGASARSRTQSLIQAQRQAASASVSAVGSRHGSQPPSPSRSQSRSRAGSQAHPNGHR